MNRDPQHRRRLDKRGRHVVAIPDEGDAFAGDATPSFLEGEAVSEGLTRMLFVAERVDNPESVGCLGEVYQP